VGGERIDYPFVAGHECGAVVEAVGSAARRVRPGDRVAIEPAVSCGACDQCLAGRPNTCRRILFLGRPSELDGCLSEYFVMPERNCLKLADHVTMAEAMLAEPLSIALHALQLAQAGPVRSIAVLGSGPIGLSVILGARFSGVEEIYATDKSDARAGAAERAGAVWTGNPEREDIVGAILERQALGIDAVFECSGDPAAANEAVEIVKPGGRIVQVGIPLEECVSLNIRCLRRKEIAIQYVRRQNRCLEKALNLISSRHLDVAWLATHPFRVDDAQRAFETAADRLDGVLKASIVF
jgi:L-iditol 2-dehydrogenase